MALLFIAAMIFLVWSAHESFSQGGEMKKFKRIGTLDIIDYVEE